jgi:pimeloyl-CoA synthetase
MEIDARETGVIADESSFSGSLLFNPETGKRLDPDDVDALIDALEIVKRHLSKCFDHKRAIEDALFARVSKLKTKTRRVKGDRRQARIEMPDKPQDRARLKKIVEKFKIIWPQLIRISAYSVKMREYKKAVNTEGSEVWNEYRDAVKSAILEPTAKPKVIIEE